MGDNFLTIEHMYAHSFFTSWNVTSTCLKQHYYAQNIQTAMDFIKTMLQSHNTITNRDITPLAGILKQPRR